MRYVGHPIKTRDTRSRTYDDSITCVSVSSPYSCDTPLKRSFHLATQQQAERFILDWTEERLYIIDQIWGKDFAEGEYPALHDDLFH